MYLRPLTYAGNVIARIISENGNVLAGNQLGKVKQGWNEYKSVMMATETDYKGIFELEFDASGSLQVDYISLIPEKTFKGRENGLREDVARFLAELKPAFIRWPGGCIVEGITLNNRVEWKKTIGDPLIRPGQYDTWGYRNSYGFGYDEFLQYCEDIGADGMYVLNTNFPEGVVGLGTWSTQVEYKDVVITDAKGKTSVVSNADWTFMRGDWTVEHGIIKQNGEENMTMALLKNKKLSGKYTVETKARKTGGKEGFFLYFGMF